MGIKSEEGRGDSIEKDTSCATDWMKRSGSSEGGSVFDPVVCELAYRWWCPVGGVIVDPFAGGSVRGIVASKLGYKYWGGELRPEQVAANRTQADKICKGENMPYWEQGDSMVTVPNAPEANFIFSCPPYGDLEVYSDDPADISNMEYNTFKPAYKRIIMRACERLKNDSFACFVVGDFRDKKTGHYRNFVSDTIGAFLEQGLGLYNEAILMTAIGSLPIRTGKQFTAGRKLGKAHQNILVFVKGCSKKATQKIESSMNV